MPAAVSMQLKALDDFSSVNIHSLFRAQIFFNASLLTSPVPASDFAGAVDAGFGAGISFVVHLPVDATQLSILWSLVRVQVYVSEVGLLGFSCLNVPWLPSHCFFP